MSLLPRSLSGRLVLTFVSGIVLTMLVTFAAQLPEREAFVFRISSGRAAHRLADQLKLMDQLARPGREQLAQIATARGMRVRFDVPAPELLPLEPGSNAAAFRDLLSEELGAKWPVAVNVAAAQLPPEAGGSAPREGFAFDVQARLSDGSWLGYAFQEPRRLPRWPMRVLGSMLVVTGVLVLLSLVAVRWVTGPLKRLAHAAEELGRDINRAPLAETGPLEVRRAARAFNAMQERLSRYIRTRTDILTAMSHDLKTPITRLRLRAELLEQPEMRDKFVRDLIEMESMVTATLGYMRGLDDQERLRPIDVRALIEALQADTEDLGERVRIEGRALEPYLGKPEGLKRCVQNLLDNALRYGHDVELAIEDRPDALALIVRDRGPGIPESQLERVFEPFYRVDPSRNPGTGGTGLGLSIARNLAQSMGGDVTLRNRRSGGLEAKLLLPRSKPGAHTSGERKRDVEVGAAGPVDARGATVER
jgi:signal transduction histidine kinase